MIILFTGFICLIVGIGLASFFYGKYSERARCNRKLNKAIKDGKLITGHDAKIFIFQSNKLVTELLESSNLN